MTTQLTCIEQEPAAGPANAAVLWLHGLGATAHDFEPIPPVLGLPQDHRIRFIFPPAPTRPVTLNAGMRRPAWYDIRSLDGDRNQDEDGIRESQQQVEALVERELGRGIESSRIVLAGFSQGGAIALHTALRFPKPLAGVMVLSAYLLLSSKLQSEANPVNRSISIFQAHGTYDPTVKFEWAKTSHQHLTDAGYSIEWHEYPMMHQVNDQEIRDIGAWLTRLLASP